MGNASNEAKYSGYASCPVFVGDKNLMLIEFKYGGVPDTTFLSDQTKPKRAFYHMKKDLMPRAYFELAPKGKWFGRDLLNQPRF